MPRTIDEEEAISDSSPVVRELKSILSSLGRGSCTKLAQETCISKVDLSLWISGVRPLPAYKVLHLLNWLIINGHNAPCLQGE